MPKHQETRLSDLELVARFERAEGFGCDANPTGDPIGGGDGYRAISTHGDFIVRTPAEFLGALKSAQPGQVVFVPGGTEIDLGGRANIDLPAGVTIAGARGMRGAADSRIVMKQRQAGIFYLFRTAGVRVRMTGLVFEGPDGIDDQHNGYANLLGTSHHSLEVDNCEIANWGYGAVVGQPGASAIHVHHCDIHHCQGAAHDGYGVCLDACDARVVANHFAAIRNHAIAGTGRPGTAYEAAYNLVESNFDMHGGNDRGDGTDIGGDWIDIHHNTFLQERAICCITRGIPSQGGVVHHNRFAADLKTYAGLTREQLASRNIRVFRNMNMRDNILEE